jgi:hypothetical protein
MKFLRYGVIGGEKPALLDADGRVAYLVSYVSQFMSLHPGDVISTGTPPGVGMGQKPPRFLSVGQTMRLGITGLGVQEQRTVAATAAVRQTMSQGPQ